MASSSKSNEPFPTPYFLPDASQTLCWIHSPFSPLPRPPTFSFSPGVGCSTRAPAVSALSPSSPKLKKFVSYETELHRSPALTTCPFCQTWVTTLVSHRAGVHAWLACLAFALCGLLLGCCLIPLFVNYFKDAHHSCPRCRRVIHVQRRTCCE